MYETKNALSIYVWIVSELVLSAEVDGVVHVSERNGVMLFT